MARHVTLIDTSTTDGDKTGVDWDGGVATLHAGGTWDGATLTLGFKPDAPTTDITTAWGATDLVLSSSTPVKNFFLPKGTIRVSQASSGGSTSLTCIAARAQTK